MFHFVWQTLSKQREQVRESLLWILKEKYSLFKAVRHERTPLCKNVHATYSKNMQYVSVHVFTQTYTHMRYKIHLILLVSRNIYVRPMQIKRLPQMSQHVLKYFYNL